MKRFITILMIMASTLAMAQNGKATTEKKTFSRETSVSISIAADAAIVWKLLTNAADFPRWNSTVISIDGKIAEGEHLKLKSTLDPKRTFKIKVKKMQAPKLMEWGSGQGKKIYTITSNGNNTVLFGMSEKIGGLMFPLYAKHIPPFDKSFEQFASDLKKEAETIQNTKK